MNPNISRTKGSLSGVYKGSKQRLGVEVWGPFWNELGFMFGPFFARRGALLPVDLIKDCTRHRNAATHSGLRIPHRGVP